MQYIEHKRKQSIKCNNKGFDRKNIHSIHTQYTIQIKNTKTYKNINVYVKNNNKNHPLSLLSGKTWGMNVKQNIRIVTSSVKT